MTNNLFFTCGFQRGKDWIIASNRERVSSIDKDKMISILNNIELNEGAAGLEFIPEPEVGISGLSVQCDSERYLFTLIEYGKDGEFLIRTKSDFNGTPGLVYFEGEPYPACSVIEDFDFIKRVFIELLETGNVSYELMGI